MGVFVSLTGTAVNKALHGKSTASRTMYFYSAMRTDIVKVKQ